MDIESSTRSSRIEELALANEIRQQKFHQVNSLGLLMFVGLLILTVLTIWLIKHFRLRYIHETGLSIIYGLLAGLFVKCTYNGIKKDGFTVASDAAKNWSNEFILTVNMLNSSLQKKFECHQQSQYVNELEDNVSFEPEIFFYVILPPIIFNAGYSMKRRHFFKNFGAIITYAFMGTLLSAFTIGGVLYGLVQLMPAVKGIMTFKDLLWYGSIISATDPVTVLAIFHDLHVDVDLYALVFGESVLNDAVAIVLAETVESFSAENPGIEVLKSVGLFIAVFLGSFAIGLALGCFNALMTKFTKIHELPLLESSLLILMSYSSYLCAEAAGMSGIVAVLFCGIFQAHYTFNNLSEDSKKRTKEFFELLNFVSENFVFAYIGLTVFTRQFKATEWNPGFMFSALFAMVVSRAVNIYPLTFILNLGRKNKIPYKFQHMMMFSGLRGAIAFALAIRQASVNLPTENILLTTTIFLVMITVIGCGVFTLPMLQWLKISVGEEDEVTTQQFDSINQSARQTNYQSTGSASHSGDPVSAATMPDSQVSNVQTAGSTVRVERTTVIRVWNRADHLIFKPILTNYRVTLADNFPTSRLCGLFSRCFTTATQFQRGASSAVPEDEDSDTDMIIEADDLTLQNSDSSSNTPGGGIFSIDEEDSGDLGMTSTSTPTLAFI